MFILVAVDAQVFPVRAVRRIVPAVPVFMVHSEQMPSLVVELPGALGAYESVNLERSFPVVAGRGNLLSEFPDDLFNGSAFPSLFWPSRFAPSPVCAAHSAYSPEEVNCQEWKNATCP